MSPILTLSELVVDMPSGPDSSAALRVLDGLSLAIAPGERVALVGPSGCGKTTLLRIIAGLQTPTAGTVRLAPGATTAMVFQRPTLLPWQSALDNALFGLRCRGAVTPAQRDKARRMLTAMGLGASLQRRPHELSEGMQQRVALARARLVEPELLLLDEPFSALDRARRRALQDDLPAGSPSEPKPAILLVSHAVEEVVRVVDRVIGLSDKPTRTIAEQRIALEHPRGVTAEQRVELFQLAEKLQERFSPSPQPRPNPGSAPGSDR